MSDESEELTRWIATLLRKHRFPLEGAPAWLGTARVSEEVKPGMCRVSVECRDGARFTVLVLQMEMSEARRQEQEREWQRNAEAAREFARRYPEVVERLADMSQNSDEALRALHYEKEHGGLYETCREELCIYTRGLGKVGLGDAE